MLILSAASISIAFGSDSQTTQYALSLASLQNAHLPNGRRVNDKVLCGGQPDGEAGFAALRALGVQTIISVDGILPDVELAHKYGMRYVHLPFGYDGVPPDQGEKIAKAIDELPGPIYVHCHHGKHRSPAAVAVALVNNGMLPPEQAEPLLTTFGTGVNYKGLWKSARDAKPLAPQALHDLKADFVERAKLPPLAEAMVSVDHRFDGLKLIQKSGWHTPADHPDLDPPHEAMQLEEVLHEIGRSNTVAGRPQGFRHDLVGAERDAGSLREVLAAPQHEGSAADREFAKVTHSCAACHEAYRD